MNPSRIGPYFVNFGGGLNSTAVLVELYFRGYPAPEAVFFADTGGERPETYLHVARMSQWLKDRKWPGIEVVRWIRKIGPNAGKFISLEEQCLTRKELPSLAYGFKGCSVKWKAQPIDKAVRANPTFIDTQKRGRPVLRVLGYDADESHRWNRSRDSSEWRWWAPLVEWGWGRDECVELLARHGITASKSACFFCPATKNREILELAQHHPELLSRALHIEQNAVTTSEGRGLGGNKRRWKDILTRLEAAQEPEIACGCFDGGAE